MEETKKKLYICLFVVVTIAVLVGCFYYFDMHETQQELKNGVLITTMKGTELGHVIR